MEGVELAARFGSITNNLKYCGPSDFFSLFQKYLQNKSEVNSIKLKNSISEFEAHFSYLKLIADANDLDPFDYEVCEAFWLGNDLLENVPTENVRQMILSELTGGGKMHIDRSQKLADPLPATIYPHHSFHVYFVKFITGKVEWTPKNADKCRVPFGKILGFRDSKRSAIIEYRPVMSTNDGMAFGKSANISISTYLNDLALIPDAEVGDWIAFHWDVGVKILSLNEKGNLEKFTRQNLSSASRTHLA